ncbi:MAG: hypothetical protein AVDCRST_MAG32-1555 [uncultured Nocardioides sp.]|uniref:DUF4397 domain-containing protein n=1 Tax=uncultured Nocardioides sp. TaxID=198441 RepID=A0A6J4N4V7_9ACTN|nr:MAG: hypothetical protein AVDCRST_MAG32-1555 [uncultured Nocardioides sp.]
MKKQRAIVCAALAVCLAAASSGPVHAQEPTAPPARVTLVQALPGVNVDMAVDGEPVAQGVPLGDVVTVPLDPGSHELTFSDADGEVDVVSTLRVGPSTRTDVVLHLPAEVDGDPVVNSYRTPSAPIGSGEARVVLAHTATAPPADVRVDGQVVFTNIANGEYAEADVPAGTHSVALLPTGSADAPILGPLEVQLEPRTVTSVYAYGNPSDRSMNVIVRVVRLSADGVAAPRTIETGRAGLAGDLVVGSRFRLGAEARTRADAAAVAARLLRLLPTVLRAVASARPAAVLSPLRSPDLS